MNEPEARTTRTFLTPKLIGGLVVTLLLVIFWAQNRNPVKVTFWVADATVRLWIALLVASSAGFVAGYLVARRRD